MNKGFVFLPLVLLAVVPCFANGVFQGSDTACFNPLNTTGCTLSSSTTGIGKNIQGSDFLTYTPDATDFTAPDTGGTVQLGTFDVPFTYLGGDLGTFDVNIMFSQPGGGGTYTAGTLGAVITLLTGPVGGAAVLFDQPTTQVFTYPGGSFYVSLPSTPILIGNGKTVALDAVITPLSSVPEPRTTAVLSFGLLLIGCVVYRRRKAQPANA